MIKIIEYNGVFYKFYKIKGESNNNFYNRCFSIISSNNLVSEMKLFNKVYGCKY